nr:MAG TPA: hypothetical protein [Crassvirales sp.]DAQ98841.1 MAG TPA: hypothetical protein [Crassvirales sp.]
MIYKLLRNHLLCNCGSFPLSWYSLNSCTWSRNKTNK